MVYAFDVVYPEARDDPLFPAQVDPLFPAMLPMSFSPGQVYTTGTLSVGMLFCIDRAFICEADAQNCVEETPHLMETLRHSSRESPATLQQDRSPSKEENMITLIRRALRGSSTSASQKSAKGLEAEAYCEDRALWLCKDLPPDQWKVEARTLFERSLAYMQQTVLDFARGRDHRLVANDSNGEVPENHGELCQMVKFPVVGWRNVNVWGFLALMGLSAAIALSSVKTEDERLWLCVGANWIHRAVRECKSKLASLLSRLHENWSRGLK